MKLYAEEVIIDLADVESETKRSIISRVYRDQAPLQTTAFLLKKTKFAIWAYLLGQMSLMQGKKKRKGEKNRQTWSPYEDETKQCVVRSILGYGNSPKLRGCPRKNR